MATKTFMTIEQYVALGEDPPGVRYELSDGELLVTPSSNYFHNEIRDEFKYRLNEFAIAHQIGIVITETDVQVGENTVRRPDVAFIHNDRLQAVDLERIPLPAPNLVIEIVSPTDRPSYLLKKVSQYLEAGVQSVWLLYPDALKASRYLPDRIDPELFSKDQEFSEPSLLPGFTLKLEEIFGWQRRSRKH